LPTFARMHRGAKGSIARKERYLFCRHLAIFAVAEAN
jgi:hypothetical protein